MKLFAAVLLLTVSLANAQSLKLRIDPAYPDQPLKTLPLLQAATPIIDVQTFEDGTAYTNLSGHSAVWYCGTSATGVFVIVTNSAAGSGYFRITPTAAQLNTNGTFWSTVLWRNASSNVLYSGTGVVQIARTTVTGNPGTLSTSIPLNLDLYSILGVLPEVNLPMAAIMTNLTAGVTPGLSAVLAVNANANGGAIANIGTLRFAPYNDTLEYDPADDAFRFGARLAGYASESTFDAATNALHGRINASGLAQTLARGNDANGGAITNVGRIGAESSAAGAVLQVRRNDGNLNEGEIIMSTGDTTGGAAMVHMEIEDVTDYYFQRDRVSLGGKPITNATMDAGALTGTVPQSRLPVDVLYSNSVSQTLTDSAAPVSGAAVLNWATNIPGGVGLRLDSGATITEGAAPGGLVIGYTNGALQVAIGEGDVSANRDVSASRNITASGVVSASGDVSSGGNIHMGFGGTFVVGEDFGVESSTNAVSLVGSGGASNAFTCGLLTDTNALRGLISEVAGAGVGQSVSVGYTGNTLPYASTNGASVAVYIPTNAATGGGQTVSVGAGMTATTNGSAVAIAFSPMACTLSLSAQTNNVANNTQVRVPLTGIIANEGGIADTANGRIALLRPGLWEISGQVAWVDIDATKPAYAFLTLSGTNVAAGYSNGYAADSDFSLICGPVQIRVTGTNNVLQLDAQHVNADATPDIYGTSGTAYTYEAAKFLAP